MTGDHDAFSCECPWPYTGAQCESSIPVCSSNPCLSPGVCVEQDLVYNCDCPWPYTGQLCETALPLCSSDPCFHGATCSGTSDGYTCMCSEQYTGIHCETEIDPCHSQPCANGATCYGAGNWTYGCICSQGFMGDLCQEINPVIDCWEGQHCGK